MPEASFEWLLSVVNPVTGLLDFEELLCEEELPEVEELPCMEELPEVEDFPVPELPAVVTPLGDLLLELPDDIESAGVLPELELLVPGFELELLGLELELDLELELELPELDVPFD